MIHRASAIALFLVVISTASFAGSYVLPSDEELVRRADAIGTFTVTSANSYYGADGLIYTRYSLATGERIKGELAPASTWLTEMGGVVGERLFSVSTSPHYAPGERVLVFLAKRGGTWSTLDGQMGKFTFARTPEGAEVLVRDQDVLAIVTARSEPLARRDAGEMIARIRQLAREDRPPLQHASPTATIGGEDAAASLTFDMGRAPWNGDPASSIDIDNAGETAVLSYGTGDYRNVIHFNVPPTFCYGNPPNCPLTGTVVGQTQLWASAKSHTFRGEEFYTADECDIVVRADLTGSILNEVTAHELGHCLGIRHSNQGEPGSGDALMKSGVGGVGANLRAWDRDAANMVYGDGTAASFPGNAYLMSLVAGEARGARWTDGAFAMNYHSMAAASCVPPEITSNPESRTITSRETAILSVSATGTAPLSFQWYAGGPPSTGIAIPGANGVEYQTPPLESSESYSVRVTNDCGSVNSNVAAVSVVPVRRRAVRRG